MLHKIALLTASMGLAVFSLLQGQPSNRVESLDIPPALNAPSPEPFEGPVIQLALLLDTSNSMDGLIDQARSRLWQIVNEMSKAKVDDKSPQLQVSLFQYGNDNLPKKDDFVQLRCPFTTDLDIISEQLFSLSTNGGQEYCGAALREALNQLNWTGTANNNILRVIVIAGNEPFNQGTEPFSEWTSNALKRAIRINTIFCGDVEEGRKTLWEKGAIEGNGQYAAIDQNQVELHIDTPFDDALQQLNEALNGTYLGYGIRGKQAKERQEGQDLYNKSLSLNSFFSRTVAKASSNYNTNTWDLVTAYANDTIKIEEIHQEDLPEKLQEMSPEALKAHLDYLVTERKRIQLAINETSLKRTEFLTNARKNSSEVTGNDLDDALIGVMKKQAASAGFEFDE